MVYHIILCFLPPRSLQKCQKIWTDGIKRSSLQRPRLPYYLKRLPDFETICQEPDLLPERFTNLSCFFGNYMMPQRFSETLAIVQPRHVALPGATSALEIITERIRVFVYMLLHHEEATQNMVDNIRRNRISGIIRFKLFGQHEIFELQMAIRHRGMHLVNAYTQLTTSAIRHESQYKQVPDTDEYGTAQRRSMLQLLPVELENSSSSEATNPFGIGNPAYMINSRCFSDRAAELEGSAVPLQANTKDLKSSTLSDRKQEVTHGSSRSETSLTCQESMCDRLDLRSESIKSLPDLCASKCHPGQHQNTLAPPTWVLQDISNSVAHTRSVADTAFSIVPPGWIDPITSYCIAASKLFTCNICGCHLDCCYATYRALVEGHTQYF